MFLKDKGGKMEICSGNYNTETHDEIVYEGKNCPLCEALASIKEKDKEIERLNEQE